MVDCLNKKEIRGKKGTFCCEKVRLKEIIRRGKKQALVVLSFQILIPYAALLELLC